LRAQSAAENAPPTPTLSRVARTENASEQLEITVYTTDPCARCIRAKDLLSSRGLRFSEVNLAKDPVGRRELAAFTGQMTFPQIVIGGEPIGGFQELLEADRQGHLSRLAA
jgi:glutaredoxin 3